MAAHGLHRSDSALGAFLRRKKAHLGAPKAYRHGPQKLARIIYSMLRYGQDYMDAGPTTTKVSISSGRCALQNGGLPNWDTNWCPCPMLPTTPRTHLPARQLPRDDLG